MKQFLTVLKFEFLGLVKNKVYILTTVIVCAAAAVLLSVPNFIDLFGSSDSEEVVNGVSVSEEEHVFALYDPQIYVYESTALTTTYPNTEFKLVSSIDEMENLIEKEEVEAGFALKSPLEFDYYVLNSTMTDMNEQTFSMMLSSSYRNQQMLNQNIDPGTVNEILSASATSDRVILGRDGVGGYASTYVLLFVLYIMILLYGQMVCTNVASEKSNRSIEVLVTSVSPNALIFGKVIAGALASILQIVLMIGCAYSFYQMNVEVWNHMLDIAFNIPLQTILTFAVFGTLGYLFYTFIFGALGALVSKVEDINTSVMPITLVFIVAFFVTFYGMFDINGMVIKVASYVPFSSFMAMFVRVSMSTVSIVEILLSLAVLIISTILMGMLGAKIYRRGTLMYGNSIKLTKALKMLKHKD